MLPATVMDAFNVTLAEHDSSAEIELTMNCPACRNHWQLLFDIMTFLWREITVQAKRLLRDIHILARAYGWSERDILAMSATRRHLYLEMVEQ